MHQRRLTLIPGLSIFIFYIVQLIMTKFKNGVIIRAICLNFPPKRFVSLWMKVKPQWCIRSLELKKLLSV